MKLVIGTITVDDEARTTLVDFTDEFYQRPIGEQARIMASVHQEITDGFIGAHEDFADQAGGKTEPEPILHIAV